MLFTLKASLDVFYFHSLEFWINWINPSVNCCIIKINLHFTLSCLSPMLKNNEMNIVHRFLNSFEGIWLENKKITLAWLLLVCWYNAICMKLHWLKVNKEDCSNTQLGEDASSWCETKKILNTTSSYNLLNTKGKVTITTKLD